MRSGKRMQIIKRKDKWIKKKKIVEFNMYIA
mgnify:CR=1 FL=1